MGTGWIVALAQFALPHHHQEEGTTRAHLISKQGLGEAERIVEMSSLGRAPKTANPSKVPVSTASVPQVGTPKVLGSFWKFRLGLLDARGQMGGVCKYSVPIRIVIDDNRYY